MHWGGIRSMSTSPPDDSTTSGGEATVRVCHPVAGQLGRALNSHMSWLSECRLAVSFLIHGA